MIVLYPQTLPTVRTSSCEVLLATKERCDACTSYRSNLRAIHSRVQKTPALSPSSTSSHINIRYLSTPEKNKRYRGLKARCVAAEKEVKRLKEGISNLMESGSVEVNKVLHQDLSTIMQENHSKILKDFPENSFQALFWNQQMQALSAKDSRQFRWHPMIIKWCLHLKMISSAGYHAMRSSGFINLPSERTLRDYTHLIKAATGIQPEVSEQLRKEAKMDDLEEWQKYVAVVFDEVKIKEDLVYSKHTSEIIGFVDLGEVNNQLNSMADIAGEFNPDQVATHMLVFMVRGLFTNLEFPYAQFATRSTATSELAFMVWDVIRNLEICEFKVIALSCDGASTNRSFFKLHSTSNKQQPAYKTKNPYTNEDRNIYFISDVPHLMKTTRNCWSHSFAHGGHRPLWVRPYIEFIKFWCSFLDNYFLCRLMGGI